MKQKLHGRVSTFIDAHSLLFLYSGSLTAQNMTGWREQNARSKHQLEAKSKERTCHQWTWRNQGTNIIMSCRHHLMTGFIRGNLWVMQMWWIVQGAHAEGTSVYSVALNLWRAHWGCRIRVGNLWLMLMWILQLPTIHNMQITMPQEEEEEHSLEEPMVKT